MADEEQSLSYENNRAEKNQQCVIECDKDKQQWGSEELPTDLTETAC